MLVMTIPDPREMMLILATFSVSRLPAALPIRIALACAIESGIIKQMPASWVAIAVAASAAVPNTPIIIEATANIPVSDITITPLGTPIFNIFPLICQSTTHNLLNGSICLNGARKPIISPIDTVPTRKQREVDNEIPTRPNAGTPKKPNASNSFPIKLHNSAIIAPSNCTYGFP